MKSHTFDLGTGLEQTSSVDPKGETEDQVMASRTSFSAGNGASD